jgi:copper homeostasis protein
MMMIRPHDGGFVYDDDDIETMLTDIEVAKSLGVQGVVFGPLTDAQKINVDQCRRLIEAAESLETTYHRAFDVVGNPLAAFDAVQQLGFARVLTSGQRASAMDGAELIRQLVQRSDHTRVLAGAGINAANAKQLVAQTGVTEIHASASVTCDEQQSSGFVSFGNARRISSVENVLAIKRSLAIT